MKILWQHYQKELTCCSEHLAVGAQAAMKYSRLMCWDLHISDQGRVAPYAERVVWEATGADDLAIVVAPAEACHL